MTAGDNQELNLNHSVAHMQTKAKKTSNTMRLRRQNLHHIIKVCLCAISTSEQTNKQKDQIDNLRSCSTNK